MSTENKKKSPLLEELKEKLKDDEKQKVPKKRLGKDEYFISIAKLVANRSTCIRRDVGAVLVKDGHIVSTGYNGPPSGFKHCTKDSCVRAKYNIPSGQKPHLCRAIHAEVNCIIQAALHGTSIDGNITMYCTTYPCINCLKIVMNAKIGTLFVLEDYDKENKIRDEMIKESNLKIVKMDVLTEEELNNESYRELVMKMTNTPECPRCAHGDVVWRDLEEYYECVKCGWKDMNWDYIKRKVKEDGAQYEKRRNPSRGGVIDDSHLLDNIGDN